MVNLRGNSNGMAQPGGYLTPRVAVSAGTPATALTKTQAYTLDTELSGDHWSKTLALSALAAPVDVIDSMAAILPGVERKATNSAFWNGIQMPGMAAWVENNHGAVEVASGVAGSLMIGYAAEQAAAKMIGSAWFAATGVGRAVAPLTQMTARAQQASQQAMRVAAMEGRTVNALDRTMLAGVIPMQVNKALITGKALEMGAKAGVSELAVVAAMNQNSAVWSDDMGQNMLFAGLGLGIGGGLGAIQGRAMVKRWANSPEIRMANAAYSDPAGFEGAMNDSLRRALDGAVVAGQRPNPKLSTSITAMALNARNDDTLGSLREGIKTQWEGETQRALAVMSKQGSYGVVGGDITSGVSEFANLWEGLRADPTLLYGASSVAKIPKGKTIVEVLADRNRHISGLEVSTNPKKPPSSKNLAKAAALKKEQPLVLVNGAWVTTREAEKFLGYQPGKIGFKKSAETAEVKWVSETAGDMSIREDGLLNKKWEDLNLHDTLQAAEGMNELMSQMLTRQMAMPLSNKTHWAQLDMAIEFAARGGDVDFSKSSFKTIDELRVASLAQKSQLIDNIADLDLATRVKYNLPLATSVERVADPSGAELKAIAKLARTEGITMGEINRIRGEFNQTFDIVDAAKAEDAMDGNLFNFNRSTSPKSKGMWLNPVMGFFEDTPVSTWTKHNLAEEIAQNTALKLNALSNQTKGPLVRTLTRAITSNPGLFRRLGNVAELADNQIGGTSSTLGMAASQVLTKAHLARNSEMLLAAQAVRRVINRVVENQVDGALKKLTPLVDQISSTAGTKSRILLNQYASYSPGWDIAKAEVGADGMTRFILDEKSQLNIDRMGRLLNEGETLMTPDGREVVLDALSDRMRMALEDETTLLLKEENVLRDSRGYEPIKVRKNYVPPQSTTGKVIGFTLDSNNRTLPGGAIVASSQEEYDAMARAMQKNLKPGERIMRSEQIRDALDLWDQLGMDFVDPTHMARPNKQAKGALTGQKVNPHALEDWLAYIKHGYEQVGSGTVRSVFDSQLKSARVHSAAQASARTGKATLSTPKNIFDVYSETLLGIPASGDSRGLSGLFQKGDEILDSWMASSQAGSVGRYTRDIMDRLGVSKLKGKPTFESLADELGPHMPFKTAMDLAEYQNGIVPPWKSKDIARHVNRLGAGVVLRWFEVVHSLTNVAGIITNMPAIIGSSKVPMIGKVKGVNVPDTMKIMALGMKRMHSKEGRADWAMMIRNGDSSQDVAELHLQSSMMNGKSSFMRVLTGDPKYADWRKMPEGMAKRKAQLRFMGIEGMASVITDSSENWSRQVSHFIGLQLADYHGITGMEARHTFARQIANDSIANYDPLNRPEIYQSAFGSMFGLFQSYALNWYQRMFRYMEDGEYKAIGRGLAMQASLFGFMGMPGVAQIAQLLGGEEEGDGLLDGIYKRFGAATGSVVAHGGLNQLTNILSLGNLPAMSIHARGDMNFRHPAADFLTTGMIPTPVGLGVLADIVGGVMEVAAKSVNPDIPMSGRHAAEILARNMPSRVLRGTITTLAAGGQEADSYGNMMSESQSMFESGLRMLGLRSYRQQMEIDAYFANQKARDINAGRLDTVRQASRALIRAGEFDKLPEVFESYLDAGGKPWDYPNWIQGLIKDAQNTRTENQLLQSLRNPGQQVLANRIQLYTQQ